MKASLTVAAPLAIALLAATGPALAGNPIDPTLQRAMQRDLGLSAREVAQYIRTERLAARQAKALQRQLGRDYAGHWIERGTDGSFKYVVGSAAAHAGRAPDGVEIRNTRYSMRELDAAIRQLDATNERYSNSDSAFSGVHSWGVDSRSNRVVVGVDKAAGAMRDGIDFVALSGIDAGLVRFERIDAPQLQADIRGGIEYSINNRFLCSVGFAVTQGTGKGFATAGHCGNAGDSVTIDGLNVGTFAASSYDVKGKKYDGDRAWVSLNSTQNLLPIVYGYGNGDVTVRGSIEAPIGAAVCRSGRTSGWHCGTITEKNTSVRYVKGGGSISGLSRASTCSLGGDSGGSFITAAGQGQGVLSGGPTAVTSCPDPNGYSLFQPLNPLLQSLDLTLVTGN
ncbi:alpha-lytic protease prodomain-containing protein [Marilutibacter maris]|nr:S1 family peptidase [Lysobacter maris]